MNHLKFGERLKKTEEGKQQRRAFQRRISFPRLNKTKNLFGADIHSICLGSAFHPHTSGWLEPLEELSKENRTRHSKIAPTTSERISIIGGRS